MQQTCPHSTNPTSYSRSPVPSKMSTNHASTSKSALDASREAESLFVPPAPASRTDSSSEEYAYMNATGSRILSSTFFELEPTLRPPTTFILGTRKSELALTQTQLVADALSAYHVSNHFRVEWMKTLGDRNQQTPLHLLTPYSQQQPAKSLWTDELEAKLGSGHFDILVHSLKDVPTTLKEGCEIACIPEREDPGDALVVRTGLIYQTLDDLPDGSIIGTGSVRRVAQLKRAYPKLKFEDMRGNLNTRLAKLDAPDSKYVALILAIAGLARINCGHRITNPIRSPALFHAVGQGALGVEIRTGDGRVRETMRGVGHWQTEWRCAAERACLRVLEGGCSVPVGVESTLEELDPEQAQGDLAGETFSPLEPDSPMLWFSGIVESSHRLPSSLPSTPGIATPTGEAYPVNRVLPPLRKRAAKLSLSTCVTSLDGSSQVVHSPEPVVVRNYQEAERFGELCAKKIKQLGGKEILDEVTRIRRERERKDLERAIEKSREQAGGTKQKDGDEHQGLQGLLQSLNGPERSEGFQ
ncbi:porphobilinogen deaminase, dipyromethane cofactor binding domain-domain-containing protein [Kockovaella imperatae]|uniref:Porphobilinogen deaminase n=1 Tax=Kockovaella imperatae TaxID=4999 RepID=A0A1Y1UDB0_9TREE|nr:porphobilinogen deaminase, dipyromethane cofactor binding domain-domain-containing protein [Kockovaella imperatae]ORX36002.1 porphobilinogen deaminase, dipyromethane cofactor binding domain-domain-containing protein [Kockovaella imperatae]